MDTMDALGVFAEDCVSSDAVADELMRRGGNSGDSYLLDRMAFIAGRLPLGTTKPQDVENALREAFLISRHFEDEIVSMTVGAFGEARFKI